MKYLSFIKDFISGATAKAVANFSVNMMFAAAVGLSGAGVAYHIKTCAVKNAQIKKMMDTMESGISAIKKLRAENTELRKVLKSLKFENDVLKKALMLKIKPKTEPKRKIPKLNGGDRAKIII